MNTSVVIVDVFIDAVSMSLAKEPNTMKKEYIEAEIKTQESNNVS